jgi:hypothetical protein
VGFEGRHPSTSTTILLDNFTFVQRRHLPTTAPSGDQSDLSAGHSMRLDPFKIPDNPTPGYDPDPASLPRSPRATARACHVSGAGLMRCIRRRRTSANAKIETFAHVQGVVSYAGFTAGWPQPIFCYSTSP